jgi:hypothetical protein
MSEKDFSKKVSSGVDIAYPDFTKLPRNVKKKFDDLPTKVNFFNMMGYSCGTFAENKMTTRD